MKKILPATAAFLLLSFLNSTSFAQGTAFTYQGRLNDGANPATGNYDLQFVLFTTNQFGFPAAPILTNAAVIVNNGLFTTTLDFGAGVFTGTNLWLDISVRTNGGGGFTELSPRQPVSPSPYAITAENLANVVENNTIQNGASLATISGGTGNSIQSGANFSTVGGGGNNVIQSGADHSTIGGGSGNNIAAGAWESFVGGGQNNYIYSHWSAIGGGLFNTILTNADYSFVGGGYVNTIQTNASYSMIAGGYQNTIQTNSSFSIINGGGGNTIQPGAPGSTIDGGGGNMIQSGANNSTIGGGQLNTNKQSYAAIGGGAQNTAGFVATVAGGTQNTASGSYAAIGGGFQNTASSIYSTIGGGVNNTNSGYSATVGGGLHNTASGSDATVPGGYNNLANGNYSFAAGQQAQATNDGAFVWADSLNAPFASTRNDQFSIRAAGGVVMNVSGSSGLNPAAVAINSTSGTGVGLVVNESSSDTSALFANNGTGDLIKGFSGGGNTVFHVKNNGSMGIARSAVPSHLLEVGNAASPAYCDGTTWVNGSDRNSKEDFAAISPRAVLEKVSALPITEWKYKIEADGTEHLGPMAQDFHAAFGLNGSDDRHIVTVDEEGVALAAIQGLNQKFEEKNSEIQTLKQQNDLLEKRLSELETTVKSLVEKK